MQQSQGTTMDQEQDWKNPQAGGWRFQRCIIGRIFESFMDYGQYIKYCEPSLSVSR